MNYFKRLYNWVLHWSNTKYGVPALFLLSLSESSFFPIPPDVLLIALCLGMHSKALYFAFVCSLASVLGAMIGFAIGYFTWWNSVGEYSTVALFFFNNIPGFSEELFSTIQQKFDLYNFFIVFTAGFTPIPFKVITISSGAFNINFLMFIIASTISRSARFFLVAILIKKFGEPIKGFIDRYFNILSILFTVLLIGGFFLIKVLL